MKSENQTYKNNIFSTVRYHRCQGRRSCRRRRPPSKKMLLMSSPKQEKAAIAQEVAAIVELQEIRDGGEGIRDRRTLFCCCCDRTGRDSREG
nr:hypothetical protein Iba_scaffold14336CG0620 [Ipomoea batatas]GME21100.1 hypothetical protein Iba_scaffold26784CG0110 [Ipomoea batatas]